MKKTLEIISCSRRTDIPAFHFKWLQEALRNKYVTVQNPFNQVPYSVDLSPEKVHSICLWSKSFANVIEDPGYLSAYNLYFQFTITGYSRLLEPKVVETVQAVRQMEKLAEKYSPQQINWRFDPIILYNKSGENLLVEDLMNARLSDFRALCRDVSTFGIKRCTISFLYLYKKVQKRLLASKVDYYLPSELTQIDMVKQMAEIAEKYGVTIYTCSNPLIEGIPGVKKGHCIDGAYLEELFGKHASHAKDTGQRPGCGCTRSRDIGSYNEQICGHGCLYCYAR